MRETVQQARMSLERSGAERVGGCACALRRGPRAPWWGGAGPGGIERLVHVSDAARTSMLFTQYPRHTNAYTTPHSSECDGLEHALRAPELWQTHACAVCACAHACTRRGSLIALPSAGSGARSDQDRSLCNTTRARSRSAAHESPTAPTTLPASGWWCT